jgi:hypothetical protein
MTTLPLSQSSILIVTRAKHQSMKNAQNDEELPEACPYITVPAVTSISTLIYPVELSRTIRLSQQTNLHSSHSKTLTETRVTNEDYKKNSKNSENCVRV